jgi:hypothetical protein
VEGVTNDNIRTTEGCTPFVGIVIGTRSF